MAIQQDDDSKQRDKFITEMAKKKKKKNPNQVIAVAQLKSRPQPHWNALASP